MSTSISSRPTVNTCAASSYRRKCQSDFYATKASMQSGSLYRGEFIFGETGVTLISASRLGSTDRVFTGKPRLETIRRQHHRHAGMQIADAVASFARKDGAGQHAVFPTLPESREGQGQTISPCDVKWHFRRFRLSRDFQTAPFIKARGRNEAAA